MTGKPTYEELQSFRLCKDHYDGPDGKTHGKLTCVICLLQLVYTLTDAVEFYANPETYHAISFLADPPCGDFADDFSEDHGDPFYDRAMPGKLAREALKHGLATP